MYTGTRMEREKMEKTKAIQMITRLLKSGELKMGDEGQLLKRDTPRVSERAKGMMRAGRGEDHSQKRNENSEIREKRGLRENKQFDWRKEKPATPVNRNSKGHFAEQREPQEAYWTPDESHPQGGWKTQRTRGRR